MTKVLKIVNLTLISHFNFHFDKFTLANATIVQIRTQLKCINKIHHTDIYNIKQANYQLHSFVLFYTNIIS